MPPYSSAQAERITRTNAVLVQFRGALLDSFATQFTRLGVHGKGAFISSLFYMLFLAFYEPALMFPKLATASTLGGSVVALRWLPIPALVIQSWAIHRLLSVLTAREVRPRRWLLLARWVVGCLPLAGVVAIPVWGALVKRLPTWGFRNSKDAAPLVFRTWSTHGSIRWRVAERRRLARVVPLGSLLFGGFLAHFLGAWLAGTGRLRPTVPVLVLFAFVHIVVAGTSFVSESEDLERALISVRRRRLLQALAWLWLFPVPIGPFGWGLRQWLSGYSGLTEGLIAPLFHGASKNRSLEAASASPGARWWHHWPFRLRANPLEQASRLRGADFHRWKTLLLALDAGAAFAIAEWIAQSVPALRLLMALTILLAVTASAGFLLLGLGHTLLDKLEGVLQPMTKQRLLSRFAGSGLLRTQASFLLGGACGLLAFNTKDDRAVWVLLDGAGVALMYLFGAKVLSRVLRTTFSTEVPAPWSWAAIGFAISALATWMVLAPTPRRFGLQALTLAGVLTPLWSLWLYRTLGGWTFRPFKLRDVFDRRLPLRLRAGVAFLMVTSAFPFGGLGSPIAIPLRRYLWPDAERWWWELEKQRSPAPPLLESPRR